MRMTNRIGVGRHWLTVIDPSQPLLQPLEVELSVALGIQLRPQLLDAPVPLVLRFVHAGMGLCEHMGNLHSRCRVLIIQRGMRRWSALLFGRIFAHGGGGVGAEREPDDGETGSVQCKFGARQE